MSFKKHVPNLFTLLNLVCGSITVVLVSSGYTEFNPAWLIFLAAFFDLLDGAIARALGVSGDLGKQLDSLADVVSFGLAPSVIIFHLLMTSGFSLSSNLGLTLFAFIAIMNVSCAAIRLA